MTYFDIKKHTEVTTDTSLFRIRATLTEKLLPMSPDHDHLSSSDIHKLRDQFGG